MLEDVEEPTRTTINVTCSTLNDAITSLNDAIPSPSGANISDDDHNAVIYALRCLDQTLENNEEERPDDTLKKTEEESPSLENTQETNDEENSSSYTGKIRKKTKEEATDLSYPV